MASQEQFRKIAVYCDEYHRDNENRNTLSSSVEDKYESCTNCKHFKDRRCELDLVDKVLSSLSMELED